MNYKIKKFMSKKNMLKKLKLFDMSIYDKYFENKIIFRGEQISRLGHIKNITNDNNLYKCKVMGTEEYDVSFRLNGEILEETSCTCPYFEENNKNCKHIYACLYNIKAGNVSEKLNSELETQINDFFDTYNKLDKQVADTYHDIPSNIANVYCNSIQGIYCIVGSYKNNLYKYFISDDELVNRINSVIEKKTILNNAYGEYNKERLRYLINKSKEENSNRVNDNSNKSNNSILGAILLIGLKSLFSLGDKKETPNYSQYTNKEINNFDLEDWQKDLVKSGNYDPNNFGEDDDMEPDDYYYDEDRKK